MGRLLILSFFISAIALLSGSCDKRSCENVTCGFRQTCINGECVCPNGYEGDNCEVRSRDKMLGIYNVFTSCTVQGAACGNVLGTYTVQIREGSGIEYIQLQNIVNNSLTAEAQIRENYIRISNQNIGATQIEGEGNFFESSNRIELEYSLVVSGSSCLCNATLQKQ